MKEKSYSSFDFYDDDSYASILLINKILQDVLAKLEYDHVVQIDSLDSKQQEDGSNT